MGALPASRVERMMQNPQIQAGMADAAAGKWTDVWGELDSYAYEIGRKLTASPPKPSIAGFLSLDNEIERMLADIGL